MSRSTAFHERSGSLGGGKGKLDRTLQLFRELTHNTASLVHGKHDEDDEDPEYLKVIYCFTMKSGFGRYEPTQYHRVGILPNSRLAC